MKYRLLLALVVCFALLAPCGLAQITTPRGSASDQTNIKLAKLDILIKLVPLALSKDQYPDLLLGIEKARQIERDTLKAEDDTLSQIDVMISPVIDNAVQKGAYPPRELQDKVAAMLNDMRTKRPFAQARMVDAVWDQVKAKLNDGQIKAMAGSFSDKFVNPSAKTGDTTSQDVKVKFYIDQVFLDPLAYDLLVEMSKHAS